MENLKSKKYRVSNFLKYYIDHYALPCDMLAIIRRLKPNVWINIYTPGNYEILKLGLITKDSEIILYAIPEDIICRLYKPIN